MSGGVEAL
jgi:cation transport regulator ChaC